MMPGRCFGDRHICAKTHCARLSMCNIEQSVELGVLTREGFLTWAVDKVLVSLCSPFCGPQGLLP